MRIESSSLELNTLEDIELLSETEELYPLQSFSACLVAVYLTPSSDRACFAFLEGLIDTDKHPSDS